MSTPCSPDGPAHPNESCVVCHGCATQLRFQHHPGIVSSCGVMLCADGRLCGLTQVYEMMLSTVRSG